MAAHALSALQWLLLAGCCAASLYAVLAALAMPFLPKHQCAETHHAAGLRATAGISVLKPLCGAEPRLYENLTTFCAQRHERFQLVLGVSSPDDPAIAVVRRLQAAWPACDIELLVNGRIHGCNRKVSNLINMAEHARHDVIVIADSDIGVQPDYLDRVTAPLADRHVGVVTCLYATQGIGGFWPRVGALFVNEWFAPSVRVAHATGSRRFGFGATLALRRVTLERIGGFGALRNCLADDYWLAERVRALGLRTVLSRVMVTTDVIEPTLASLWQRETRWLRTIRSVRPHGFACLFITFTSPWLMLAACLAYGLEAATGGAHGPGAVASEASIISGGVARVLLHWSSARHTRTFWRDLALTPLRDTLLALQWLAAAFGVDHEGRFGNNMVFDGVRFFLLPHVKKQLASEIRAQFEAFGRTGLALDHVNTHKHFHLHPTVLRMILDIGSDYGMRAMRLPYEVGASTPFWLKPWITHVCRQLDRAGIAHNDYLMGIAGSGHMDEASWLAALAGLPDGVGEIYCHPATAGDAPLSEGMRDYRHADELHALLSPGVAAALRASGATSGGFCDVLPAR